MYNVIYVEYINTIFGKFIEKWKITKHKQSRVKCIYMDDSLL